MGPLVEAVVLPIAGGLAVKALDLAADAWRRVHDQAAAESKELPRRNTERLDRIGEDLADVRERVAGIEGLLDGVLDWIGAPKPPRRRRPSR